ncbi:MAG: hypothetical protein ACRDPG_11140, partial [Nocardioidaceae bacterium]
MAARISILAAAAVGLSVAAASLAAYITLSTQLHHHLDDSLLTRATQASRSNVVTEQTLQSVPADLLGAADIRIYLVYANGTFVCAGTSCANDPWVTSLTSAELTVAKSQQGHAFVTLNNDGESLRAVTVPSGNDTALMFVESAESIERTLD